MRAESIRSAHTLAAGKVAEARQAASTNLLLFTLVLLGAAGLRLLGIRNGWLWLDELLAANFANNSFPDVIVTVLRFDVHSPLYYLQLSAWLTFGTSDAWIMLNSTVWSLAGVGSLYWVARRLAGEPVALTAAALFAVMPGAVLYGYEVRMYAVIMTAIIWAWYFNHLFTAEGPTVNRAIGVALAELAVIYSHAAGTLMVLGVCAYGFATLVARRDRAAAIRWLLLQGAVALAALPALIIAVGRQVKHPVAPDLDHIVGTLAFLMFGPLGSRAGAYVLVAMLIAVLVAASFFDKLVRRLFVWAIAVPLATIALVSIAGRPIWLERTVSFIVPLVCLTLALALWRTPFGHGAFARTFRIVVVGFVILLFGATSLSTIVGQRKGDGFRPVAEALRAGTVPGDVVSVTTSPYDFWCLAWYFAGPGWGGPLEIHDVPQRWREIYDRLGPEWLKRLNLDSDRTELMVNGVRVVAGAVADLPDVDASRVWRVSIREDESGLFAFTGRLRAGAPDSGQLIVERPAPARSHRRPESPGR